MRAVMRPIPGDSPSVRVEIHTCSSAADLSDWLTPDGLDLSAVTAHDSIGALPVQTSPGRLVLRRPPLGEAHLTYAAPATPATLSVSPRAEVDPDRFRAIGGAIVAVPQAWVDRTIPVSIRIDTTDLHTLNQGIASSLGVGNLQDRPIRVRDLLDAMFLSGPMGQAFFDTPEGRDEAAWFGYSAFDPRPASADIAAFRTAARQYFGDADSPMATLLFVVDRRSPGAFVATRRSGGVILHLGVAETWSAPVRISVAAKLLKAWIGERLWVGPTDPEHEAEAYWFTEGVTRHLARDLLSRFGLITPEEIADEVTGMEATVATSRWAAQGNVTLASHSGDPGVVPLMIARGVLYAARVNALLRSRHRKASLDDVIRRLYKEGEEARGPLRQDRWIHAVTSFLGPEEQSRFAEGIEEGRPIDVPDDALGLCFRRVKRRHSSYDPGFDEDRTRAQVPRRIVGVREGGPAWRAGVRDGDLVVEWGQSRGRSEVPVTLVLDRPGSDEAKQRTVTFLPAGPSAEGHGWVRRKGVPDDLCVR